MRLNGATGDGINIRFMIENSGGMQDRDIAKTSAALLAAEIDDFLRNPSGQNVIVPTNLRILVDTFWQKDNDVKTEGIFDFRLGQSGRQNYKGLREWSNKWFVNREVTLDKLVNRNWPTDNKNTILIILTNTRKGISVQELLRINADARQVNSGLYIAQLPTGKEPEYRDDNVLNAELAKRVHSTFEWLKRTLESLRFSMSIAVASANGEVFDATGIIVAQAPAKIMLAAKCKSASKFFWRQDGREIVRESVEYQFNDAGEYEIQAVGIDLLGDEHVQVLKFDIRPAPDAIADFTVFPTSGLAPLTISVTNKSNNASKYQWNWGDGSEESMEREPPQHTYDTPGKYPISLNVLGENGSNGRKEITIVVQAPPPVAEFQVVGGPHDNANVVEFSNKSRHANRYEWDFGDGTPMANTENPKHKFKTAGSYKVLLKAFSPDGTAAIAEGIVVIRQNLKASFRWHHNADTNEIVFSNTSSGGVRYHWNFGDGADSADENPRHAYATTDSRDYSVRLTVFSNDGRQDSINQIVTVAAASSDGGDEASGGDSEPLATGDDDSESMQDGTFTAKGDGGSSGMLLMVLAVVLGSGAVMTWLLLRHGARFTVELYSRDKKLLGQKVVKVGQVVPITDLGGNNDLSLRIVRADDDSGDEYKVSFRKPDESTALVQQKAVKLGVTDQWGMPVDLFNLTVDNGRLVITEGIENEEEN